MCKFAKHLERENATTEDDIIKHRQEQEKKPRQWTWEEIAKALAENYIYIEYGGAVKSFLESLPEDTQ